MALISCFPFTQHTLNFPRKELILQRMTGNTRGLRFSMTGKNISMENLREEPDQVTTLARSLQGRKPPCTQAPQKLQALIQVPGLAMMAWWHSDRNPFIRPEDWERVTELKFCQHTLTTEQAPGSGDPLSQQSAGRKRHERRPLPQAPR